MNYASLDWIKAERVHFKTVRDKNNDNLLDREEILNWILPNDFDHTLNEAKHLIYEADENQVIFNIFKMNSLKTFHNPGNRRLF
jgi:hypothetical protein